MMITAQVTKARNATQTDSVSGLESLRMSVEYAVRQTRRSSEEKRQAVSLRPGMPTDASRAGEICYEAFKAIAEQHSFPPDFPTVAAATDLMRMMLSRSDIYSVIAERAGEVVGSNFLWEADTVAGVGPITIDQQAQNGSIGRMLMEDVLARALQQGKRSVRLLQAAYHSRSLSLYAKLGFVVREPFIVLQGAVPDVHVAGRTARAATTGDLEAANELCQRVHGHDRSGELSTAIEQGSARVVESDGRISGYTTGIGFFGHAVGESASDLKALIASAPCFAGPGFLLPMRNSELFRWSLEHGLRIVQPMTLMSIGDYQEPDGAFLPSILY